jgi:sterol desaturase/sphingolipid hydroxylase (fatty acid hydroxylase superfamily)
MLPVFDRIFGAYHVPADRWPSEYGIGMPAAASPAVRLTQPMQRPMARSGAVV